MRLLNTCTGQFQEFFEAQRPQYAILSHTWGNEEVSYFDILLLTSSAPATTTPLVQATLKAPRRDSQGFLKVQECCRLALSRGFDWVWIDTCCVDKSSSAELSEAMNSMWNWYSDAGECIAYLFDVVTLAEISSARWFGRGWTLQELLAPRNVIFCNPRWEVIATKSSIGRELSQVTRIPLIFLDGTHSPPDGKICSVAMRMSWIARRQTSRTEDMTYCLLGLFNGT